MRPNELTEQATREHAELSRVTLLHNVESECGLIPAGATGTIMHVYPGGAAYEIELTAPVCAVVTVKADDVVA